MAFRQYVVVGASARSDTLEGVEITVYGRPSCVQCEYTTKLLARIPLAFKYVDIDDDENARKLVQDSEQTQLPMVTVIHDSGNSDVWHGFRPQRIRDLHPSK